MLLLLFLFAELKEFPNHAAPGLNGYWQETPPAAALASNTTDAEDYIKQLGQTVGTETRGFDGWTITGKDHSTRGSLFTATKGSNKWTLFVANYSFARITQKVITTLVDAYEALKKLAAAASSASATPPRATQHKDPVTPSSAQQPTAPTTTPQKTQAGSPQPQPASPPLTQPETTTAVPQTPPQPSGSPQQAATAGSPPPTITQSTPEKLAAEQATKEFVQSIAAPTTWAPTTRGAFTTALNQLAPEKRASFSGGWETHAPIISQWQLTPQQITDLIAIGPVKFVQDTMSFLQKLDFTGIGQEKLNTLKLLFAGVPNDSKDSVVKLWNTRHKVDTSALSHEDVLIGDYIAQALLQLPIDIHPTTFLVEISQNFDNIVKWLKTADKVLKQTNIVIEAELQFAVRLLTEISKKTPHPAATAWNDLMANWYTKQKKKNGTYAFIQTPDFK